MVNLNLLIKENKEISSKKINAFIDESYNVYILGAELLSKYAKKFKKNVDEKNLRVFLEVYMVVVKLVDRATDDGKKTMEHYCDILENPTKFNQKDFTSLLISSFSKSVKLNKKDFLNFRIVAKESFKVSNSKNVKDYLHSREKVTKYLAKIGLRIIEKFIKNKRFGLLVYRLLNSSDLLDIVFDLKEDKQRGEIKFKINFFGYLRIYEKLIRNLFWLFICYPFLLRDFFIFSKKLNKIKS